MRVARSNIFKIFENVAGSDLSKIAIWLASIKLQVEKNKKKWRKSNILQRCMNIILMLQKYTLCLEIYQHISLQKFICSSETHLYCSDLSEKSCDISILQNKNFAMLQQYEVMWSIRDDHLSIPNTTERIIGIRSYVRTGSGSFDHIPLLSRAYVALKTGMP